MSILNPVGRQIQASQPDWPSYITQNSCHTERQAREVLDALETLRNLGLIYLDMENGKFIGGVNLCSTTQKKAQKNNGLQPAKAAQYLLDLHNNGYITIHPQVLPWFEQVAQSPVIETKLPPTHELENEP